VNEQLVPLSHLALEVGADPARLARQFADTVLTDDLGRLCVDRDQARQVIAEHNARAAQRRLRSDTLRAGMAKHLAPVRNRVRALREHQELLRARGLLDNDMTAIEAMCAGDEQERLDGAPSRRMDAWLAGRSTGGRFTPQPQEQ
jgi:hypothetical protein